MNIYALKEYNFPTGRVPSATAIDVSDWMGPAVPIHSRSRQVAVKFSLKPDTVDTVI